MSFLITGPYEVFNDLDGDPLENGNIYIGSVSLEPVTNPVVVYSTAALTGGTEVTQPIRTLGGYPVVAGSPINLYIAESSYSIELRTKNNKFIYSDLGAVFIETSVLFYDFISDMAALLEGSLQDKQQITLTGYHVSGDGGGGSFYWDATSTDTPNGGTIIAPDVSDGTGRWIRIVDDAITLRMFGAALDGVTDDSTELLALDAIGGGTISIGTALIKANITLTGDYEFISGGIIEADTGFTVTWSGSIEAENYKIFGGAFALTKVHSVSEIPITWFGALPADLDTDTADQSLADANGKAIREAMNMSKLGIPDGVYRTPVIRIPTGLFIVDDDNTSGAIFETDSYNQILGWGINSVIRPMDAAKVFDVIQMSTDSGNSIYIDNLQIYGEASAQSNAQNGININPTTNAQIYNRIGPGVFIKEMSGYGIAITGAGLDNSTVEPFHVRDSTLHNLFVQGCDRATFRNTIYRTAKSGSSGAVFDGAGVVSPIIHDCLFDENNVSGLIISNVTGRAKVYNNRAATNATGVGFSFDRCDDSKFDNNYSELNDLSGFLIDRCDNCSFDGSMAKSNGQHGFAAFTSTNNSMQNISSHGNSQETDNTFSGVFIGSNSDDNNLQGATVRHLGGGNQQKYGIEINDTLSNFNLVTNNDLKNSGKTSSLFDNGSGTVTTAGNRI